MRENDQLPTPPWWSSRETRHAARGERRRQRREARHTGDPAGAADAGAAPREPITPERIADAALRVIDAQGIDGLTVRSLAVELGVGTMTLYWYVQNKDEVLELVADRLLADVTFPPPEIDWRVSVREGCASVRAALLRHARAVPIIVGRGAFGPNGLRMTEASIAVFRAAGFDPDMAADAYFTISNFVTGFCIFQTSALGFRKRPDLDLQAYGQMLRQYVDSLPTALYPNLHASAERIFGHNLDERFTFGVDCLIAGFEAQLEASTAGSHDPAPATR
jgi:TetR/AcrR family transcriptional regulator, tetracycline repressor protein